MKGTNCVLLSMASVITVAHVSAVMSVHTQQIVSVDVGIWGGTICAITGAIAAARMNHTAAIVLEYGTHLGGMTTGGLSAFDLNMPVGGIFAEFLLRAGVRKGAIFPNIEPHVSQATFEDMLQEVSERVTIIKNTSGLASVETHNNRIVSLTTASGTVVTAQYFMDCSYEGDLLQLSGTPWLVGREASSQYNESFGGAEGAPWTANRYAASVSPWTDNTNTTLLPTVSMAPQEAAGEADEKVQSMNYRLCVTNVSNNSVPLDPPSGYNPQAVELLRRWWASQDPNGPAQNWTMRDIFLIHDLPDSKVDVNNGNMTFGTDMPFLQFAYPTGNWSVRKEIAAQHEWWIRAVWTFLSTDNSGVMPKKLQAEIRSYGLCADEWNSTNHWPPQLYVREGVRMQGSVVLTQHDVLGKATSSSPASVGLSRWLVDIHAVQRVATQDSKGEWWVVEAGHFDSLHQTWQLTEIPYGALIPARGDTVNLLVPVCASLTHVAFASYRLEAQFGIFGQSAAVAAVQALEAGGIAVQDVDVHQLQLTLLAQGQILNATRSPAGIGNITLLPCVHGNVLQQWSYQPSDGTLRLTLDGGSCVSIYGYNKEPGADVWAAPCHTSDPDPSHANQEFDLVPAPGGEGVQVRSRLSHFCVSAMLARSGSTLVQLPCDGQNTAWAASTAPADGPLQLTSKGPSLCAAAPA